MTRRFRISSEETNARILSASEITWCILFQKKKKNSRSLTRSSSTRMRDKLKGFYAHCIALTMSTVFMSIKNPRRCFTTHWKILQAACRMFFLQAKEKTSFMLRIRGYRQTWTVWKNFCRWAWFSTSIFVQVLFFQKRLTCKKEINARKVILENFYSKFDHNFFVISTRF